MTLREKHSILWKCISVVILEADKQGTPVCVLEWMRTPERQALLVSRGASKTMNSKHLQGLAIDIAFLEDIQDDGVINYPPDKYKVLGELWESMGGRWGGRFGDDPSTDKIEGWDAGHFEYQDGMRL